MRFAHLADAHIGAWRDSGMKDLSLEAFRLAITNIIKLNPDFVLIAGDLFHTALPSIDHLKQVVIELKRLKQKNISIYIIPGSHDYNASGKSILDVLEEADLLINVMKTDLSTKDIALLFTIDKKTGAKITGFGGKKGGLEKNYYQFLNTKELEEESGFKIFMFHTSIDELKPKELEEVSSMSANLMPKGFDYYAGGHIHIVEQKNIEGYNNLIYPGPVFPANFSELWKLENGGFYFYDNGSVSFNPILLNTIKKIDLDANNKTPKEITFELETIISSNDYNNSIVLIRVCGVLASGKPSDIDFKNSTSRLCEKKAFFVMRNTSKLSSKDFEEISISSGTADEIEEQLIIDNSLNSDLKIPNKEQLLRNLLGALSQEQRDGEKKYEYDLRVKKEVDELLNL